MLEIFQYEFMVRAFIGGIAIAIIAPMIGTFLVLKRYSLFADSLAHVALTGVAIGVITHTYPLITAVITCVIAAIIIEKLRSNKKIYEESALSLFLSGSLAVALVLISLGNGLNTNLLSYLFGSITTVTSEDVAIISLLSISVIAIIFIFYQKLFYIAFDEESAKVSGLPIKTLNLLLMITSAVTVSLSMRVVGTLMIGALMVIPVLCAIQIAKSFLQTFFYSIVFSILAVIAGLFLSYYVNIIAGGSIVLVILAIFVVIYLLGNSRKVI